MPRRRSSSKSNSEARSERQSKAPRSNTYSSSSHDRESQSLQSTPAQLPQDRSKPRQWTELRNSSRMAPFQTSLTRLIEQDAPLQTNTVLVFMYGPFQAEMVPGIGQGVASWIKECLRKYGLPSLVRFDYRRRAQVFRRDQFQPWLEPLIVEQ